ncbi:branched-chain amino acid ABC transporter permease [Bengtsoniella intestinalis]|uniref:branched-chain amino acid ABC transporter permease n=1 Tax=Bengtsoniella intestinalis TaxID=3073143 RepID=UPI00391FABB9
MNLQIIINGISIGAVYSLIAVGFCLVFSILKFTNFAHGAMMTAAAFAGYFFAVTTGWGLFPTIIASIVSGALIGLASEFIAFRRITTRSSSVFYYFVSSLTLATLLEQLVTIYAGSSFITYPGFLSTTSVAFGSIIVSYIDILMFFCSIVALGILVFIIDFTKIGRAVRAASFDRPTTYLMGIDVIRVIQMVFVLAGSVAGLSGVFLGLKYTLYPTLGNIVIKGFIASIIGGLGSIPGAVVGAFLLGVLENIIIFYFGSAWAPVVVFFVMMSFLLLRPQGLFGRQVVEKA